MSKSSLSCLSELGNLIEKVLFRWPLTLLTVKAEVLAEAGPLKQSDDTDPDASAAWQTALLILQALCQRQDVLPLQNVPKVFAQARK